VDKKKPLKQPIKKGASPSKVVPAGKKSKIDYHLVFLWIVIAIVSAIRYRLITVPFERDEGEYGYIGGLFLHGMAPFNGGYSMKLPGTSFMYAIFMGIFGHTNSGVHMGMVFINAATMYFLFTSFKKLFNPFIGLTTASIFGLMAIGLPFDGFAAHATQFICFYSSLALLFLADFMKSGKMLKAFLCGLMLGMAFLMKQQAIFLILFGGLFLLFYVKVEKKQSFLELFKKLFAFSFGVFIPYIIVLLIVLVSGEFSVFWLWTVKYASTYESVKSLDFIMKLFMSSFTSAWAYFYYLWVLGVAGILVLWWSPYSRTQKVFVIMYFIASALALSSGFYFRPHYFIVILPAIGLLTGIFVEFAIKQLRERMNILKSSYIPIGILSIIIAFTMYTNRDYYFNYTPRMVCAMAYWGNPFNEAQEIAKYIKENTKDTDKIAVLGSEPEICFYANRMSASGYIYTYPLVEIQPYNEIMQEQMIQEIEKSKPAYFIFCNVPFSWLAQKGSPMTLMNWANKYINTYYTPVGFADFFSNKGWSFYWNDDIKYRVANPESSVAICKRKPDIK
jgi:hypothetical protein